MKLKNIGNKIVSVGKTLILPGKAEIVEDSYAENPVVKLLISKRKLAEVKEGQAGKQVGGKQAGGEKAAVGQ